MNTSRQEQIMDKYYNLSNKKKVEILESALVKMQQYNGRGCDDCICLSMIDEFPELDKIKKQ